MKIRAIQLRDEDLLPCLPDEDVMSPLLKAKQEIDRLRCRVQLLESELARTKNRDPYYCTTNVITLHWSNSTANWELSNDAH